ncbi:MAG TPA: hypothetical protein VN239_05080 [Nitrososphaera sp.]|nr:hypothetical protein [Nitrososphaera sp.]
MIDELLAKMSQGLIHSLQAIDGSPSGSIPAVKLKEAQVNRLWVVANI